MDGFCCPVCTFNNPAASAECSMCGTPLRDDIPKADTSGDALLAAQLEQQQPVPKKLKKMPTLVPLQPSESAFAKKVDEPLSSAPTSDALNRISLDLKEALRNKHSMFRVLPERRDMTKVHALLFGPAGTPYEHGLFHFQARFPATYPWQPPLVVLRTTDSNQVRFGPNLYVDGKVCLSILGTWTGPSWTPVQTLTSVLLSILSLLNPLPYHNEPGFEGPERNKGEAAAYNLIVRHETLRVAVCGMLENPTWPLECDARFVPAARELFMSNCESMLTVCAENARHNGQQMVDPFGQDRHRNFDFDDVARRIRALRAEIELGAHLQHRRPETK
jgi:ubiquitin-conjugating enzyme E2 Z